MTVSAIWNRSVPCAMFCSPIQEPSSQKHSVTMATSPSGASIGLHDDRISLSAMADRDDLHGNGRYSDNKPDSNLVAEKRLVYSVFAFPVAMLIQNNQ